MQCDHGLGQLETKQGQAQFNLPLNSNQINFLGGILKHNDETKHCPKIHQPLLINSKYSVGHVKPSWRF